MNDDPSASLSPLTASSSMWMGLVKSQGTKAMRSPFCNGAWPAPTEATRSLSMKAQNWPLGSGPKSNRQSPNQAHVYGTPSASAASATRVAGEAGQRVGDPHRVGDRARGRRAGHLGDDRARRPFDPDGSHHGRGGRRGHGEAGDGGDDGRHAGDRTVHGTLLGVGRPAEGRSPGSSDSRGERLPRARGPSGWLRAVLPLTEHSGGTAPGSHRLPLPLSDGERPPRGATFSERATHAAAMLPDPPAVAVLVQRVAG